MTYEDALKEAGATVHCYKAFGSWQGDWYAKVTFENKTFWVHGSYGSCSVCDALQGLKYEFDYNQRESIEFKSKLANFGLGYLQGSNMTQAEALAEASRYLEWDSDAEEMVDFVTKNALQCGARVPSVYPEHSRSAKFKLKERKVI